jgi:prepilin-type N-terminal cleavage/methylation domain-containing protein
MKLRVATIRRKNASARPGFTLVELMVAIAIVVILAALSLAIVPGMLDRALLAADNQKMREIAVGLGSYASDQNATLPNQHEPIPDTATSSSNPDRWNFHECVDRYLGGARRELQSRPYSKSH